LHLITQDKGHCNARIDVGTGLSRHRTTTGNFLALTTFAQSRYIGR